MSAAAAHVVAEAAALDPTSRYFVVAVNETFWLGQLCEPFFTSNLIVPVAFFAVVKRPLTVLRPGASHDCAP